MINCCVYSDKVIPVALDDFIWATPQLSDSSCLLLTWTVLKKVFIGTYTGIYSNKADKLLKQSIFPCNFYLLNCHVRVHDGKLDGCHTLTMLDKCNLHVL